MESASISVCRVDQASIWSIITLAQLTAAIPSSQPQMEHLHSVNLLALHLNLFIGMELVQPHVLVRTLQKQ